MDTAADPVLFSLADQGWSVCARERRIVFLNGGSCIEVPVVGLLRWARDGDEISFDDALEAVPEAMHGWVSMAALIGLRHCLGAAVLATALPPGYADWDRLGERVAPLVLWMAGLERIAHVEVPAIPMQIDDGLNDGPDDDDARG